MTLNKPRIRCMTYGGYVGWILRKYFSFLTSGLYLEWQYHVRKRLFKRYIELFENEFDRGKIMQPCLISIETINRCNSTCSFCPANRYSETRPFKKMDEGSFHKIIQELEEIDYSGYLNLYVNNEPLLDKRIEDWYIYAKHHLPNARMLLYTNGTLLSPQRFKKLIPVIDKCIINNYSETLKLHDNIRGLLQTVRENRGYWEKDICIQIRYIKEILTNRAGTAPNKRKKRTDHKICIMPYTDMTIFPDGTIGLCCSDALEKTNLGNINDSSIMDIWSSDLYQRLRKKIGKDRDLYPFCKGCDFVDAGIRNGFMDEKIKAYETDKYL